MVTGNFRFACTVVFWVIFGAVCDYSAGIQSGNIASNDNLDLRKIDVDDVLAIHIDNYERLATVCCDFSASVSVVSNEQSLANRRGDFLGNVQGRFVKKHEGLMIMYQVADLYRTERVFGGEKLKGILSPFPCDQLTFLDSEYAIQIANTTGSGSMGPRESYFPNRLFDPSASLGVCSVGPLADPVHWLKFPSTGSEKPVSAIDGNIVKVTGTFNDITLETWFDVSKGASVCYYSVRPSENQVCEYEVDEFVEIGDKLFFPKMATGTYVHSGEFPRRCVFWNSENVSNNLPIGADQVVLTFTQWELPIYEYRDPTKVVVLRPRSLLNLASLPELVKALESGGRMELPTANSWPAATLNAGCPLNTIENGAGVSGDK